MFAFRILVVIQSLYSLFALFLVFCFGCFLAERHYVTVG